MYRTSSLGLLSRRMLANFKAFASTDASVDLPNPSIAMAPDANHIVCYHPEKPHPYEHTKAIDRTDPTLAQSDTVFNSQVQRDFENRYYKKQVTEKDFRLESEQLGQMFNEHPALFRRTPKLDKMRRAPQFAPPKADRSGI